MVDFYFSIIFSGALFFGLFQVSETLYEKLRLHVTLSHLDRVHWVKGDERAALSSLQKSNIASKYILWEEQGHTAAVKTPLSDLIYPDTFELVLKHQTKNTYFIREQRLVRD